MSGEAETWDHQGLEAARKDSALKAPWNTALPLP